MSRPTNASLRMKRAWITRRKKYVNGFRQGHTPNNKRSVGFFSGLRKMFGIK
jgi:hypothetical protein